MHVLLITILTAIMILGCTSTELASTPPTPTPKPTSIPVTAAPTPVTPTPLPPDALMDRNAGNVTAYFYDELIMDLGQELAQKRAYQQVAEAELKMLQARTEWVRAQTELIAAIAEEKRVCEAGGMVYEVWLNRERGDCKFPAQLPEEPLPFIPESSQSG